MILAMTELKNDTPVAFKGGRFYKIDEEFIEKFGQQGDEEFILYYKDDSMTDQIQTDVTSKSVLSPLRTEPVLKELVPKDFSPSSLHFREVYVRKWDGDHIENWLREKFGTEATHVVKDKNLTGETIVQMAIRNDGSFLFDLMKEECRMEDWMCKAVVDGIQKLARYDPETL